MAMTPREAIQILMLSPIYFQLGPAERRQLIKEYCELFTQVVAEQESKTANN
jgi:hypothetical protein